MTAAFQRIDWGVIENTSHDLGTDLFVMARDRRLWDLGLLVGVQVKAGPSYFREPEHDEAGAVRGWWFRDTDRAHVDAWVGHGLPHLLVLHDLGTRISYWAHVTAAAVVATGAGAKVLVPAANTVDDAHRDTLLEIAATLRPPMAWEGSAWTGAASLRPRDLLRYALTIPRLIAPHPNLGRTTAPTPEQMIALLVQARVSDAQEFATEHAEVPPLKDAASSPMWAWRFMGGLAHRLTTGETGALPTLVDDGPDAASRAAAAVTAAAALLDDDRPDEALTLLEGVLARDDAEPVDHAWLQVQHARVCAEVGRSDEARAAAVNVQAIRSTHPADATATALAGIAAELLYRTSDWAAQDVAGVISAADTTAAWWRTEMTSSGLSAVADRTFRRWAHDTSTIWAASDPANDRLLSASLMANHLGDHRQWRYLTGLLGRDALLRLDRSSAPEAARKGLELLRLAGDRSAIELAVHRLATDGPATAVTLALADVDLRRSTRTTGTTNLALLEHGGDLADVDTADRSVTWLLSTLADPGKFIERTSPSYLVDHYLLKALAGVLPAASPTVQHHVAEHIAALVGVDDQGRATDWARVAGALLPAVWDGDTARNAATNASGHDEALRWALLEAAARSDPAVRQAMIDDARTGSSRAFAALGDVRGLPADLVAAVITRLAGELRRQVADAHQGRFALSIYDPGHNLAVLNVWHPDMAEWDPVLDLLADRRVSGAYKEGALRVLASSVDRVPDGRRSRLVTIAEDVVATPEVAIRLIGSGSNAPAVAAELLAAFAPDRGPGQLLELLHGDTAHRQSAARAARRLAHAEDIGVLVTLTSDPEPAVRATAAAALASLVAADSGGPLAEAALLRCASDPGTSVPVSIAATLANELTRSAAAEAVLDSLRFHPAAAVRRQVATATA